MNYRINPFHSASLSLYTPHENIKKPEFSNVFREYRKKSIESNGLKLIQFMSKRSTNRKCSVKKGVFKSFTNFTGKRQRWIFVLIKLHGGPATSLKEDPTQLFSCET